MRNNAICVLSFILWLAAWGLQKFTFIIIVMLWSGRDRGAAPHSYALIGVVDVNDGNSRRNRHAPNRAGCSEKTQRVTIYAMIND